MSDRPFRVTLYLVDGTERDFPVYLDAARANIERAAFWSPSPVNPKILDHLNERDALFAGTVLAYGDMARLGQGVFGMIDDEGRQWSVPARSVLAISAVDPEATARATDRPVGFRFRPPGEAPTSPDSG